MHISDDDLQQTAEEGGELRSGDRDAVVYQKLFEILREPVPYTSSGIEDAILSKIEKRKRRNVILDHLWLVLGVLFISLIGITAVALSGIRFTLTGWEWNIIGLGICGGIVIGILNTIERKLLKGS